MKIDDLAAETKSVDVTERGARLTINVLDDLHSQIVSFFRPGNFLEVLIQRDLQNQQNSSENQNRGKIAWKCFEMSVPFEILVRVFLTLESGMQNIYDQTPPNRHNMPANLHKSFHQKPGANEKRITKVLKNLKLSASTTTHPPKTELVKNKAW